MSSTILEKKWTKSFCNTIVEEVEEYILQENPTTLVQQCTDKIVSIWTAQIQDFEEDAQLWNETAAMIKELLPPNVLTRLLQLLGQAGTFKDNFDRLESLVHPNMCELDLSCCIFGWSRISRPASEAFWCQNGSILHPSLLMGAMRSLSFADIEGFEGSPCLLLHALCSLHPLDCPNVLSQLEHLDLSGNADLLDITVVPLMQSLSSLQFLNVSRCNALTDVSVRAIANGASQRTLRVVDLSFLTEITHEGLEHLSKLCALECISLKGCKQAEAFCLNCPKLTTLDLSLLDQLHGERIKSMLLPLAPSLKVFRAGEGNVHPETFSQTFGKVEGALKLQELDVSWCESLTPDAIVDVVEKCPELKVCLLRVTISDDSVVRTIAENCPKMEVLSLSRCASVTDASLVPLALGCPLLTYLDLGWCVPNTSGAEAVIEGCSLLRYLSFQGCKNITAGVIALFSDGRCPFLRFLDLAWVNNASTELVTDLTLRRKRLSVVNYYCETYENGVLKDI